MSARTGGCGIALLACALVGAFACGDDESPPPVGRGNRDAGDAAGPDAQDLEPDAAFFDADIIFPPDDAGRDAMIEPPLGDDAEVLDCEQDCDALTTECRVGYCDLSTLECKTEPRQNGIACGSQELSTCTAPDTCQAGVCEPRHEDEDTPCGDQGQACRIDDACDGEGNCVDHGIRAVGTACGDATDSACDGADSCNAQGECDDNHAEPDAPCGDQGSACRYDDACDGNGSCVDHGLWEPGACPPGVAIGPDGRCGCGRPAGSSECMPGPDVCVEDECVPGHEHYAPGALETTDGLPCGSAADTQCDDPDACLAGVCVVNTEPALTPCGSSTSTTCNGADSCDGFGNCNPRFADGSTVCGEPAGECFQAPRCNGAGTCLAASALPPSTPCGDGETSACNGRDTCDGFGACSDNYVDEGVACNGPPSGACDLQDECNGAGQCVVRRAAPGTICGDDGEECENPDTCNAAGVCVDNGHAPQGSACGSSGTSACDLADSCDGSGACVENHVPAGEACGDPPGACRLPSSCTGAGECAPGGFEPCTVMATWVVTEEGSELPLQGVTVELVGASAVVSGTTDAAGEVQLEVPGGEPIWIRARPTATHWGRVKAEIVDPADSEPLSLALLSDDDAEIALAASGLAALDATRGVIEAAFFGHTTLGGEAAQLTPPCVAATCGPITVGSSGNNVVSPTLLESGSNRLTFVNLSPGSYAVEMTGASGVSECAMPEVFEASAVYEKSVTYVWADCVSP